MNKQALKLKKKRRALKEQEKQEMMNKIWDEINGFADEQHLPKLNVSKATLERAYRATKQMDSKIITKTGVVSLITSIHTLTYNYNFDKEKILNYAKRLQEFIKLVVSAERPIKKIIDEINYEYQINIMDKCKDIPILTSEEMNDFTLDEVIIKSTTDNYPYLLTLAVYTLIYDLNWNTDELNKFIDLLNDKYLLILNDISILNKFKDELLNDIKVDINLDTGVIKEIL